MDLLIITETVLTLFLFCSCPLTAYRFKETLKQLVLTKCFSTLVLKKISEKTLACSL